MNLPIITLEVEGMKHAIKVALTKYAVQMDAEVQAAIDATCTKENIARIVEHTAKKEIEDAIKSEVGDFFRYGNGRRAIKDAVLKTLDSRGD